MRYFRTRKTAWQLRQGDLIEHAPTGTAEAVTSVRRMLFTGELDGVTYRSAPRVRLELGGATVVVEDGDKAFNIWRPRGATSASN